jgi:hypothetical protein
MTASVCSLFQQIQVLSEFIRVRETCQDTWKHVRRGSPRLSSVRGGLTVHIPSALIAYVLELEPNREFRELRIADSRKAQSVKVKQLWRTQRVDVVLVVEQDEYLEPRNNLHAFTQ